MEPGQREEVVEERVRRVVGVGAVEAPVVEGREVGLAVGVDEGHGVGCCVGDVKVGFPGRLRASRSCGRVGTLLGVALVVALAGVGGLCRHGRVFALWLGSLLRVCCGSTPAFGGTCGCLRLRVSVSTML